MKEFCITLRIDLGALPIVSRAASWGTTPDALVAEALFAAMNGDRSLYLRLLRSADPARWRKRICSVFDAVNGNAKAAAARMGTSGSYIGKLIGDDAELHESVKRGKRGWSLRGGSPFRCDVRGPKNHNWKGDAISGSSGRIRARNMYPALGACERCAKPAVDRHHVDGNTANNERQNVRELCRRCHMEEDGRLDAARCGLAKRGPRPAKSCINCEQLSKPTRHGRCNACAMYFSRTGTERPLSYLAKKTRSDVGKARQKKVA